jgi:hypothetical protein
MTYLVGAAAHYEGLRTRLEKHGSTYTGDLASVVVWEDLQAGSGPVLLVSTRGLNEAHEGLLVAAGVGSDVAIRAAAVLHNVWAAKPSMGYREQFIAAQMAFYHVVLAVRARDDADEVARHLTVARLWTRRLKAYVAEVQGRSR